MLGLVLGYAIVRFNDASLLSSPDPMQSPGMNALAAGAVRTDC